MFLSVLPIPPRRCVRPRRALSRGRCANPSFPVLRHTSAFFWAHVCPRGSVHRLFGDVRSQPSLNLRAGRDASCRTHCGVQRVPNHHYRWQRFLVGRALHPIILCHSNAAIIPSRPVKQLGMPKPDLPLNQRLPDFFAADSIRPILPSSLASACFGDKAGAGPSPQEV